MVRKLKPLVLFNIGGLLYFCIELLWRSKSHWSMYILGGLVFLLIGSINIHLKWSTPLWIQCGISMIIITVLEFVTGCIVNLWLGWDVWNYTRFDILGQVCLPFIGLWYLISSVGIILDDVFRWLIFKEEKPHYRIF